MADEEKSETDVLKEAAEHCEKEAETALDRGLNWVRMGGPASAIGDFEKAGALFTAAEILRKRSK